MYPQVETSVAQPAATMTALAAEKSARSVVPASRMDMIEKKGASQNATAAAPPPTPTQPAAYNPNSNYVDTKEATTGCVDLRVGLMVYLILSILSSFAFTVKSDYLNTVLLVANAFGLYAVWRRNCNWLKAFRTLFLVSLVLLGIIAILLFVLAATSMTSTKLANLSYQERKHVKRIALISGFFETSRLFFGISMYPKLKQLIGIVQREHEQTLPK